MEAKWHVVVIGNNSTDLQAAEEDALMVGDTALRSGLCSEDNLLCLLNKDEAGIRTGLCKSIGKMSENDRLLVWYSGHAKADSQLGTLIFPAPCQGLKDLIIGLWLESWLIDNAKPETLVWCIVAACRDRIKNGEPDICRGDEVVRVPSCAADFSQIFSNKTAFMFLYACEIGASMWDTQLFAKMFCFQLGCLRDSIQELQQKMNHEVEVLSYGLLKMTFFPEQQRTVSLFSGKTRIQTPLADTPLPVVDPQYLDAIQRFQLLAIHLQVLTDRELARDVLQTYGRVRSTVYTILHRFKEKESEFQENFAKQIPILASCTLQDALAAIENPAVPKPSLPVVGQNDEIDEGPNCEFHTLVNIPEDVLLVIGTAVANWQTKLPMKDRSWVGFPAVEFRRMLEMLGGYYTAWDFETKSWFPHQQCPKDVCRYLSLCCSEVQDVSDSDSESLVGFIEEDCKKVGINIEDLRIYIGQGSLWIILVSPVPLDTERVKRVVNDFVDQQRSRSFAWAFATAPREEPWFAAPGLGKVVSLMEGLRRVGLNIPRVMCLRGRDIRSVALQLLHEKTSQDFEDWQVRVESNNRSLKDEAWVGAAANENFHFVTSKDWRSFVWEGSDLVTFQRKLADLAKGFKWVCSPTLHAIAFLVNELQKDPPHWFRTKLISGRLLHLLEHRPPEELFQDFVEAFMSHLSAFDSGDEWTEFSEVPERHADESGTDAIGGSPAEGGYLHDLAQEMQRKGKGHLGSFIVEMKLSNLDTAQQIVRKEMIKTEELETYLQLVFDFTRTQNTRGSSSGDQTEVLLEICDFWRQENMLDLLQHDASSALQSFISEFS